MSMPVFHCPCCRNPLTWDVVFAHEGVRDAMVALVNAHPDGAKLLRPLLGYVGLFAPEKTAMRYDRIAGLLAELTGMIREAALTRNGRTWTVPMDYWRQAIEEMLARRDAGGLRVPLSSHGYLFEILIGYCSKAEAAAETQIEKQRAGHAGAGSNPNRAPIRLPEGPVVLDASLPKNEMPGHVRERLHELQKKLKSNQKGN